MTDSSSSTDLTRHSKNSPQRLPALEIKVGHSPRLNSEFPGHLEAFQEFVGGHIDVINLDRPTIGRLELLYETKLGPMACVVVNDEGILLDLPPNPVASKIAGQPVFGDVLICDVP